MMMNCFMSRRGHGPRPPPADESDDDSLSIAPAKAEDPPETRPETLEPLPLTADPNYPQEDARTYFTKISNVRTDKFSLGKMLDGSEVKIPTLLSVFSRRDAGSAYIE
jgi:hypothetical protein